MDMLFGSSSKIQVDLLSAASSAIASLTQAQGTDNYEVQSTPTFHAYQLWFSSVNVFNNIIF